MAAIDHVLERLERVRRKPGGWTARCPAHPDKNPSLAVGVGEDGRVLLRCMARQCPVPAICEAIGLEIKDLFDDGSTPTSVYVPKRHARPSESSPPLASHGIVLGESGYQDPLRTAFKRTWVEYDENGEIVYYSRGELVPFDMGVPA